MELGIFVLMFGLFSVILVIAVSSKISSRGYPDIQERKHVPSAIARILDQGPQCAHAVGVYKTHKDKTKN